MKELAFLPVNPSYFSTYNDYWGITPIHTSDYTVLNLWAWSDFYGLKWAFSNELCWIQQTKRTEGHNLFWSPIGDWFSVDWKNISLFDKGITMCRVPEQLCSIFKETFFDRVRIEETIDQWEYIYLTEDLLSLAGRKFDAKRNHLKAYQKQYSEDYRPITAANTSELIDFIIEYCKLRNCLEILALKTESNIVCNILNNWEMFPNLIGGVLYNNNNVMAFSIGEALDKDSIVVHIEKGMPNVRGVYQAINNCFVKNECKGFTYVNREQDLGEEGLRKAKQSYNPVCQLKKNKVIISPKV